MVKSNTDLVQLNLKHSYHVRKCPKDTNISYNYQNLVSVFVAKHMKWKEKPCRYF